MEIQYWMLGILMIVLIVLIIMESIEYRSLKKNASSFEESLTSIGEAYSLTISEIMLRMTKIEDFTRHAEDELRVLSGLVEVHNQALKLNSKLFDQTQKNSDPNY